MQINVIFNLILPPLVHLCPSQSSIFTSHIFPVNPGKHEQCFGEFLVAGIQTPKFLQGSPLIRKIFSTFHHTITLNI